MSDKHIYFMRPVGQIGPIKIGCSKEPEVRLVALAIQSPVRLEIIATAPGTHADERRLHGMFAKHWTHHEWFNASKELLALVAHVERHGELPELPAGEVVRLPRKRRGAGAGGRPIPSRKMLEFGALVRPEYEVGATCSAIAARHGRSPQAVARALRAVGLHVKRGPPPMPKHVVDQARADEFQRRYLAGETLQQIGDEFGVTRERVRQILRKTHVPSLGRRPEHFQKPEPLTDVEREAAHLYDTGTSPAEIERRLGINSPRLRRALEQVGVESKGAGFWNRLPNDEEITSKIVDMYQAGSTVKAIAAAIPEIRAETHIYRYLHRAGVPTRLPGHARGRKWSCTKEAGEQTRAKIIELHQQGKRQREIAQEAGVSIGTVQRHLSEAKKLAA